VPQQFRCQIATHSTYIEKQKKKRLFAAQATLFIGAARKKSKNEWAASKTTRVENKERRREQVRLCSAHAQRGEKERSILFCQTQKHTHTCPWMADCCAAAMAAMLSELYAG